MISEQDRENYTIYKRREANDKKIEIERMIDEKMADTNAYIMLTKIGMDNINKRIESINNKFNKYKLNNTNLLFERVKIMETVRVALGIFLIGILLGNFIRNLLD